MLKLQNKWTKFVTAVLSLGLIGGALSLGSPASAADLLPPVIATVNPSTGTITGGERVTVTGSNLQYVTGGSMGTNPIDFTHWVQVDPSGHWISFESPWSRTTGKVDLTLYSSQNNITEPQVFTYTATAITSVTPNLGPQNGGTKINIKGTGFGPMEWGDSSLAVRIGGAYATNVVRVSPTEITAVTPAGTIGQQDVTISFNNYTGMTYSGNTIVGTKMYTYAAGNVSPVITAVIPNKGTTLGGNEVTIKGQYLHDAQNVNGVFTFDGLAATLISMDPSGNSAVVSTPAHALGAVDVKVSTSAGSSTLIGGFTYSPPPTVTSVAATSGVTQGGTKVTITGTNFGTAGAPVVKIGGKLALCTKLVSPTTITAVTRDNAAGTVDVEVTATTGAGTASLPASYTYQAPATTPSIASITPNSGPTSGNTTIEIKSNDVFPADTPNVMIGQLCALSVARVDDHTVRAVVPAGQAGAKNVSLTFANAYSLSSLGYTYIAPSPAAITSIYPNWSFTYGLITVMIQGQGFGVSGTPTVTIGGVAATNVTRSSDNLIWATVPANSVGAKTVVVTPQGGSPISLSNGFTYRGPSITKVTPDSGDVAGGTAVTITGEGFGTTGTPTVTFNGVTATSIVRVSDTTITAVSPSGVAGLATIVVTPQGGTALSNNKVFTYLATRYTPMIYSSTPSIGPAVGGETITVAGVNFKGVGVTSVKIAGQNATNVVINQAGTVITFTAPALAPGLYEISVTTDKGTAWQNLYRVLPPPTLLGCPAVVSNSPGMAVEGGTVVTVWGDNFGTTAVTPTVTVGGVQMPVSDWGYDNNQHHYWLRFTDAGGSFGYQTLVVTAGDNSGSATISNCLYRHAYNSSITADDKSKQYGAADPTFTFSTANIKSPDVVGSVVYTFTGTGGVTYGPSTTPPQAAGVYTITPSAATMTSGSLSNYLPDLQYISGTYTIYGISATVTAASYTKVYGDADPTGAFTASVSGLKDAGDDLKSGANGVTLTFTGTDTAGNSYGPTTTPPTNAGSYVITPHDAHLVSGTEGSYQFSYFAGTYTITKRPLSISAPDQSKTYGDSDPALPWEFTDPLHPNLAYSDTKESITGTLGRTAGEDVGTYQINLGDLANHNPNYEITSATLGVLSINPKHINVTADDQSKIYGNGDPTLTYTSAGLIGDDTLSGALSRDAGENVGTYSITVGSLIGGNNYIIDNFTSGTLTITKRPVEITPYETSKIYGENDPTNFTTGGLGSAYYISSDLGLAFDDTFSGALSRATGENVGTYNITQGTVDLGGNYNLSFVTGKQFTINKRPIWLAADNKTKVYGDADPSPFTYSVVTGTGYYDLVNGDTITGSASRTSGEDVGYYDITLGTLSAGSNYELGFTSGTLQITPKLITVKPDALSKTYGDNDPTITYTITDGALVNGDTSLGGTIGRGYGEDAGTYNYDDGYGWNSNYTVTVDKTNLFTINKKDIAVTADANSKTYGDGDPTLTWSATPSTMTNGAPINLTGDLTRDAGEDVGTYNITQGTLSGGTNFNIVSFTGATFTINKRDLWIQANDQTITYGDPLPTNSVFVEAGSALYNGDTLGDASYAYDVATPANAGTYTITPSAVAFTSGSAGNYNIYYDNGTLTINKKAVHISVDNQSKDYGAADPTLTFSLNDPTELVGGDSVTGTPARESGENVGTYGYLVGSLTAGGNYDLFITNGTFTINKLKVVVTPTAGQTKVYGDNDPTFTYTTDVTLPFEETLSGNLGRTAGEDVGNYDFNLGSISEGNSNYDVSLAPAQFGITKRDIAVTADNQFKTYGDADPTLTYSYSPTSLPNGTAIVLTGDITRDAGENVGDYNITQGTLDGGSNFNLTGFTGAKLTINKRTIHVVADDQSVDYGQTLPANSWHLQTGDAMVGTDALGTASYTYSTAVPVHGGTYDITPSAITFTSGLDTNYDVQYVNGTLTINALAITVTADDKSRDYGATDPAWTYLITSGALVGEDSLTGSLTRDAGNSVGTYPITQGSLSGGTDYTITFVPGTLTINKLHVKVTPTAGQTKVYGDNNPTYTFSTDLTLPYSDSLSGSLDRTSGEDVGSYDFNLGNLVDSNPNYDLELVPATFGITKRDITVSVVPMEKFYGDADPEFSFTYSPTELPNGTPIVLTGSPERAPGENVGDYNITQGTLDGGSNFNLTGFTGAKLTIKKRPITIVAADQTAKYGQDLPANSWSLMDGSSLAFEDAISGVSYDYSSTPRLHVGSYDIIPSAAVFGTGDAANYDITYQNGTIVITKATLTVTIDNASSSWGDAAPSFRVLGTNGLVDSDAIGSMTYTVDGNGSVPTAIGQYVLDGTLDGMDVGSLDDYEVTVVPATYLIDGPQVINFDPPQGPTAGGTQFTIYGTGFGFENPTVLFDGVPATDVQLLDSGTIAGITPPHAEGPVDVQLVIGDQTIDLGMLFTYIPPPPAPTIDVLWPGISPTNGGSTITINGANFCGSDNKGSKVYVDGVLAKNIVVSADCKTITFKTPTYKLGVYRVEVRNKDGVVGYDQAMEYVPGSRSTSKLLIFKGDSSVLKPGAKHSLKTLAAHLKGKADVTVKVFGWVHKTVSNRIDAALSLARAKNTVKYLKSLGVVGTFTYEAKGIYHKGDYRDRRAEVDATWTE